MITNFFAILIPLVALDAVWLLGIAKGFYARYMGFLFNQSINFIPIYFFYPIYSLGILFFVLIPALNANSWMEALWRGALLGLVSYGAYDLTNHATISGWPKIMTFVDMGWGVVLTSLTSVIAFFIITSIR